MKNLKLLSALLVLSFAGQVVAGKASENFKMHTVKTDNGIFINADGRPSILIKESKGTPNCTYGDYRYSAKWANTTITPDGVTPGRFSSAKIPLNESNYQIASSSLDKTNNSLIARLGIAKKCKAYLRNYPDGLSPIDSYDPIEYVHLDCLDTQIELHNLLEESMTQLIMEQNADVLTCSRPCSTMQHARSSAGK